MNPNEPVTQWRETFDRLQRASKVRDLTPSEARLIRAAARRLRTAEKRGWDADSSSPTAEVYDAPTPTPTPAPEEPTPYFAGTTRPRPAPPTRAQVVRGGLPGLGRRR